MQGNAMPMSKTDSGTGITKSLHFFVPESGGWEKERAGRKMMNTTRSDEIAKEFLAKNVPFKRKVQIFDKEFSASPQEVFKQLCPSREADWINGWTVDLIYTQTGYAEPLCVFRTPESNILGAGLWILTKVEPDKALEATVFQEDKDTIEFFKIDLIDNGNGTCKGIWTITLTAISEKGNAVIEQISDEEPAFLEELEYFLKHGELMEPKKR